MSLVTLLGMSLKASALILLILIIRFIALYKLPKRTFYVMWGIALYQLLVPYDLFARLNLSAHIAGLSDKLKEVFTKATEAAALTAEVAGTSIGGSGAANAMAESEMSKSLLYDRFGAEITAVSDKTSAVDFTSFLPVIIWAAGFIGLSAYFIVTHIKSRKLYAEALPVDYAFVRAWRVGRSDKTRRKIIVKQSDMISSPLTYGIIKPVILLPADTDYGDEATLEYILLHEYTHIRRFDVLAKLILAAALCVHWFNPFVWLMFAVSNRDIEISCDESIVRLSGEKSGYAFALIALKEKRSLRTADAHFSMSPLTERIKSIMKTTKISVRKTISAALIISVTLTMLAFLQSCDKTSIADFENNDVETYPPADVVTLDESFIMPEPTDKLVVYTMSMTSGTIKAAVNIFKEKYPDVDVEIISMSDEEYNTVLKTELAAGKGPDLMFSLSTELPDIYKTMSTEIFVDLNQFIGRDDEFELDDYVTGVLNGGVYKGKRYIMPIEYGLPILTTTKEALDAEGVSPDEIKTFDGLLRTYTKYNENHIGNADKSMLIYNNFYLDFRYFLMNSGIELIDYDKNKVSIDEEELKLLMETMKPYYTPKSDNVSVNVYALTEGKSLFNNFYNKTNYMLMGEQSYFISENKTPLMFMCPSISESGTSAEIMTLAAIPKASENQINAYNLMKILLSDEIQGGHDAQSSVNYLLLGNPVLKSAVRSKIEQDAGGGLNSDIINDYVELMANVGSAKIMPKIMVNYVYDEMTPYFEGRKSFGDCYANLVSVLELYLSE